MPTRASYEFKIEGLLRGSPGQNSREVDQFKALMQEPTEAGAHLDSGWPNGVRLPEYEVCRWKADGYPYGEARDTLLSLQAEITYFTSAGISDDDVQKKLIPEVTWFYKLKGKPWYQHLAKELARFNEELDRQKVIEPVRMRDWRWYCGNAGGG